jgi:hypothetical protein
MRSATNIRWYRALSNCLLDLLGLHCILKLLGLQPGRAGARTAVGELIVPADDLAAIRCLRATYPDRPTKRDCAEYYRPEGRLIWEESADADD